MARLGEPTTRIEPGLGGFDAPDALVLNDADATSVLVSGEGGRLQAALDAVTVEFERPSTLDDVTAASLQRFIADVLPLDRYIEIRTLPA